MRRNLSSHFFSATYSLTHSLISHHQLTGTRIEKATAVDYLLPHGRRPTTLTSRWLANLFAARDVNGLSPPEMALLLKQHGLVVVGTCLVFLFIFCSTVQLFVLPIVLSLIVISNSFLTAQTLA